MGTDNPSISVYKHARKDSYLFLRRAPLGNGATTAYGDFVHINPEDMRSKGLDLVLADFQDYPRRDPKHGSVISGLTPEVKKARKFLRAYDEVMIYLYPGSLLHLGAVSRMRGDSGVVRKEDVLMLPLPCSNELFFDKLLETFKKCCYVANA